jgi:hypothetical protein
MISLFLAEEVSPTDNQLTHLITVNVSFKGHSVWHIPSSIVVLIDFLILIQKEKILPSPNIDLKVISPPSMLHNCFERKRPRPLPKL